MESGSLPLARPSKLWIGLPLALLAAFVAALLGLTLILGASSNCGGSAVGGLSSKVPSRLVPIYEEAASRYGLGEQGPAVLAAINEVETDFGRDRVLPRRARGAGCSSSPRPGRATGVDADGTGSRTPTTPGTRSSPRRATCAPPARRVTGRRRSSPTTTPSGMSPRYAPRLGASGSHECPGRRARRLCCRRGLRPGGAADGRRGGADRRAAPPLRMGRLPRLLPDSPKRAVRLLLGGLPSAPGRRLSQPDDRDARTRSLGRSRPRSVRHDPRQARRARSSHLHRVHARRDAAQ